MTDKIADQIKQGVQKITGSTKAAEDRASGAVKRTVDAIRKRRK